MNNNTTTTTATEVTTKKMKKKKTEKKPGNSYNKDKSNHKVKTQSKNNKNSISNANKNKRKYNKHNKTSPSSSSSSSNINNLQRSKDIKQCQTLLSHKQFRLFKDDKQSTQYGFTLDNKTNGKFVVVVPNDYPKHSIRLLNQKNDQVPSNTDEYNCIIKNFNQKCKLDHSKNTSIVSQLNYLSVNHDILMNQSPKDFNNYMHLHKTFYTQFK